MPILEGNIKLLASQVMDDVAEGGGQATGTAIADGASNAIFSDISELDRAIGRVNLRKTFVSVDTASRDSYYGANVIVSDPPDDQRVSCTLFTTNDGFDRRTDAQGHLEAYVLPGPLSRMRLYGTQFTGQRAILTYQRVEETLPEVGQVFVLSVENAAGTVTASQFVRLTDIAHEVRTFTDSSGDFTRRVLTLGISDALRQNFVGAEPRRTSTIDYATAQVRESQVADAAQYFSAVPLAETITTGALAAKVESIYTQLVPSSTTETPVSMAQISAALGMKDCASSAVTENIAVTLTVGVAETIHLLRGCKPGSLNANSGALIDDGFGNLTGAWVNSAQPATIDYANGVIVFTPTSSATGTYAFSYTPAVEVSQASHTNQIEVELASRGSVYSVVLDPVPLPGTTVVDYMALGKWYRLRDNGVGVLAGDDPSVGTGSVNFTSGAVVVTLGALPDVGTSVMFAWGSPAHFEVLAGATSDAAAKAVVNATLTHLPVVAGSVSATWYEGSVAKTATADGSGTFTGSGASGTVDHTTGVVRLELGKLPDADGAVEFAYNQLVPTAPENPTVVNAIISGATGFPLSLGGPVAPNGLTVSMSVVPNLYGAYGTITMTDDGAGSVVVKGGQVFGGSPLSTVSGNQIVGTINYATGELNITATVSCKTPVWETAVSSTSGGTADGGGFLSYKYTSDWVVRDGVVNLDPTQPFPVSRRTDASGTSTPATDTLGAGAVTLGIDLTATKGYAVVPGSVSVTIGGRSYVDRSGTLYTDINRENGSGLPAGTVDYTTGALALTLWNGNIVPAIDVQACLTQYGNFTAVDASFRTSGAPVRPASFYVQVTDENGTTLSGTSNTSGVISGAKVRGTINHQTGVVFVEFGELVVAAGNEAEWWYDADLIDVDGKIWKPQRVLPSTIRYNCVVLSTLPLDASIIGIDPVRLPSDGRVPILRPGNVAVVHHTGALAPTTVSNGQTLNAGRVRLARFKVIGNDGNPITSGYTTDLDAGTITFTDVTGYSQPVTVQHRIEDMALVSDAQISGDLRFTRQITHDYPLGSYVSSALIVGDMKARVPVLFDQATWSNAWSDTVSGSNATGTFNDVIAPIAVTNKGAITERWSLVFTSTTNFNIIGEHVGLIGTGGIGVDCSPMNPAAGVPYFTVPALGWGTGWAAGNALRFNTIGALFPVWIARTIQQGPATAPDDSFTVLIRGDVDRP